MTDGRGPARLPIVDSDGHAMEPFDLGQQRRPDGYGERAGTRVAGAEGERVGVAAVAAHLGPGGSIAADLAGAAPGPAGAG